MLDAINLLHSRYIAHGDVRMHNFLVGSPQNTVLQLKLRSIGGSSLVKENLGSMASIDQLIQYDLKCLGLVLLELDNSITFDSSAISDFDLSQICYGGGLQTYQLNRSSLLYEIASSFLLQSTYGKVSARSALLYILQKSEDPSAVPLFSIILKS